MSVSVLLLAGLDSGLLDQLGGLLRRAIHASTSNLDIVSRLSETPEQSQPSLGDTQLVLTRATRSFQQLSSFLQQSVTLDPCSPCPSRPGSAQTPPTEITDTALLVKKVLKRDKRIRLLQNEMESLHTQLDEAVEKARNLEAEQEQFFEDVQHMKTEYDKLFTSQHKLLWEYLPSCDARMASIPCIRTEVEESDQQIGEYPLQDTLGYGQYAAVYASKLPERPDEQLAIKAIDKDKLVDLVALHRMSSEIAVLRDPGLYHPSILALKEVIHTRRFIYLITERGGKDLFEYFGVRESGLPEAILKPLVHRVALAIETLHRHQYCHRDLKPENILYAPDHPVEAHVVKLVDFGLCTKGDTLLSDFCGSPGFFAPEILLQEQYDGRQADIWSLGCILLELLVGNDRFATMWMSMYELDTLKDRTRFAELVEKGVEAMQAFSSGDEWCYSSTIRDLLLRLLRVQPQDRLTVQQMLQHPWFHGISLQLPGLPLIGCDEAHHSSPATHSPQSPVASVRSPPRLKTVMSAPIETESSLARAHNVLRPLSADHTNDTGTERSAPQVSALVSASPTKHSQRPISPKCTISHVSLPSLSPEKPIGAKSPEKSFTKRHPSHVIKTDAQFQ